MVINFEGTEDIGERGRGVPQASEIVELLHQRGPMRQENQWGQV